MLLWNRHLMYMFPPIPLIMRTIVKIQQDRANAILVAPCWPRQPWFMMLTAMATDSMMFLTKHDGNTYHPDIQSLHLTAWRIPPQ